MQLLDCLDWSIISKNPNNVKYRTLLHPFNGCNKVYDTLAPSVLRLYKLIARKGQLIYVLDGK